VRKRLGVVGALVAVSVTFPVSVPTARADGPQLALASQTPWVGPGQDFGLRIALTPAAATGGQVVVTVFNNVPNRSEFARTLDNHIGEARLTAPIVIPLDALALDAAGARDLVIPTQDPTQPRDRTRLALPRSGVFPVRIEYRPPGAGPPAVLVTHLLYLSGPVSGSKLNLAWVVPLHARPHPEADGIDTLTAQDSDHLAALVDALSRAPTVPVVLAPTPDTLAALAAGTSQQDRTTLSTLRTVVGPQHHQVIAGGYVPVPLAGLVGAGLADDATRQLTTGSDVLASTLRVRPDGRTWVESGGLTPTAAAFLRGAQVDRLVVPETGLSANPFPVTLAQPFTLNVNPDDRVLAAAADPGLAAHFQEAAGPVLAAHHFLADLMVLYEDRPGQTRGVVAVAPRAWAPDPAFLRTVLDGLAASPVVAATSLDTLFATVPPATTGRSAAPLVRTLVTTGPTAAQISADIASFPVDAIRSARRRVEGFGSALGDSNPILGQLERGVLVSESADLADLRARQVQVDLVNHRIGQQFGLIQLPTSRKITLTARTGRLPITVFSGADYPLRVVLRVTSDKLSFPGFGPTGTATQSFDLHKGDNSVDFTVRARTSGAFPLHINVLSADSQVLLASTTFTIQSTALSGVGLFLSLGAAGFLALWWGRQIGRDRRRRRKGGHYARSGSKPRPALGLPPARSEAAPSEAVASGGPVAPSPSPSPLPGCASGQLTAVVTVYCTLTEV